MYDGTSPRLEGFVSAGLMKLMTLSVCDEEKCGMDNQERVQIVACKELDEDDC
jgi:hypothetical protein